MSSNDDIDLIPTEVIVRMRDEKRKARWSKLTKDAATKAVETKRKTPELLRNAGRKAAATRKIRNDNKSNIGVMKS